MKELSLREQQLILLDILKYFDGVCRKHNIKYTLCGGTLIGAIRHKGFIPWDDDIDIYMLREEYDRFRELWNKETHKFYRYVAIDDFDNPASCLVAKIFDTRYEGKGNFVPFIDIFPLDYMEDTEEDNRMLKECGWYIFASYKFRDKYQKSNNLFNKIVYKWKAKRYFKKVLRIFDYYKNRNIKTDTLVSVGFHHIEGKKGFIPAYLLDEFIEVDFEGEKIPIITKYDELLTAYYGDYMQLPPEEERVPPHQ